eukprot:10653159-Alexandrium_andersonii.AAC.1
MSASLVGSEMCIRDRLWGVLIERASAGDPVHTDAQRTGTWRIRPEQGCCKDGVSATCLDSFMAA